MNTDQLERQYPFADACSRQVEVNETITLPKGYTKAKDFPKDVIYNDSAASFQSSYALDENIFIFNQRVSLNKRVYEAADWSAFRTAVNSQKENMNRYITITK